MLSDQTVRARPRSSIRSRVRTNRVGLRLALAVIATVYIVGPTAAQWVALDETRSAIRSEFVLAEAQPSVTGASAGSIESAPPSPAGVVGTLPDRVQAVAEPVADTTSDARGSLGPDPIGSASDGAVVDLVSPAVPEGLRQYIPAVIEAVTARTTAAETAVGGLFATVARGLVVLVAVGVSVVVGARLGNPYRPRHAQTDTAMRVFF